MFTAFTKLTKTVSGLTQVQCFNNHVSRKIARGCEFWSIIKNSRLNVCPSILLLPHCSLKNSSVWLFLKFFGTRAFNVVIILAIFWNIWKITKNVKREIAFFHCTWVWYLCFHDFNVRCIHFRLSLYLLREIKYSQRSIQAFLSTKTPTSWGNCWFLF